MSRPHYMHKIEALEARVTTREDLRDWILAFLHIDMPEKPVCPDHDTPLDYLWTVYDEPSKDVVVVAPRGGGKTRLAAVATVLDLLHKPGCAVRLLGGSLAQSLRVWEHLLPDVEKVCNGLVNPRVRGRHAISLKSGSSVVALPQSQRAVRGLRVQKMRCDEVEMFDKDVWDAAQLVTKSITLPGGKKVRGAIEALSTHHKPWGLMSRIIDEAPQRNVRVIKWCILDVLETCPPERACNTCELLDDCKGIAKEDCKGFFSIDDAITLKKRVSRDMWDAEMLCKRPNVSGCVFPNFSVDVHVVGATPASRSTRSVESVRGCAATATQASQLQLALDFGFANPFVCLWIAAREDGTMHVIDEYVQPGRTVAEHLEQIESRPCGKLKYVACDPAGAARSDQTATSNVALLRSRGYRVRTRHTLIQDGLEMIRAALRPAIGEPRLFIDPNCKRLIKAMQAYRYPDGGGEVPLKDGEHDHLVDALRYWFVNRRAELPPPRRY